MPESRFVKSRLGQQQSTQAAHMAAVKAGDRCMHPGLWELFWLMISTLIAHTWLHPHQHNNPNAQKYLIAQHNSVTILHTNLLLIINA